MANLTNFKTDVTARSTEYTKFMVSRVFNNGLNPILEIEEPTELPQYYMVEINLYSLADNSLIFNITYDNTVPTAFLSRKLQYSDEQIRNLLFIDFTKLDSGWPVGEYQAVFYFFVPEIGTEEERTLGLSTISPSRTEVELRLLPEYDTEESIQELSEFSTPRITADYVFEAVGQIFGKTSGSIPSNNAPLDYTNVEALFPDGLQDDIRMELESITAALLDIAHADTISQIQSDLDGGKETFTDTYLNILINSKITDAYGAYVENDLYRNTASKYILREIE